MISVVSRATDGLLITGVPGVFFSIAVDALGSALLGASGIPELLTNGPLLLLRISAWLSANSIPGFTTNVLCAIREISPMVCQMVYLQKL